MTDTPRAYTAAEARALLIDTLKVRAVHCAQMEGCTPDERCMTLLHSVLAVLDGQADLPAFDLVLRPHPDDQAFCAVDGENWFEDGMVINGDAMLHEELAP